MTKIFDEILEKDKKWRESLAKGPKADLRDVKLRDVNSRNVDLRDVNFRNVDLKK